MGQRAIRSWINRHSYHSPEQNVKDKKLDHRVRQYVEHFHHERNHQGKDNVLLFPTIRHDTERTGPIQCHERLGGLLKYYDCDAA